MNKAELKPLLLPFSQHTGAFSTHSFVCGGTRGDLEGSFWFQNCKHDFYDGIPQIRKSLLVIRGLTVAAARTRPGVASVERALWRWFGLGTRWFDWFDWFHLQLTCATGRSTRTCRTSSSRWWCATST